QGCSDLSVPAYWRVMSIQSQRGDAWMTEKNEEAIRELELEYEKALQFAEAGFRADDLLYQCAHFYRLTDRPERALELLATNQARFPQSNWKEGCAYYLGSLYAAAGERENASAQWDLLKSMELDSRMFDFDGQRYISVSEAVRLLENQLSLENKAGEDQR
ncbi:MAG: hypothetical protein ACPGVU_09920, partial [Limisphaerales bacterium]